MLRMTTDRVPNSNALQKEVQLPIGVIVKPYGEPLTGEGVAAVSFGQKAIVRCKDCRSYVNPFVRFIENGLKWICNFCGDLNPTDSYYYSPLNNMGLRQDYELRTELRHGSVDFVASNEYMNRPHMPPPRTSSSWMSASPRWTPDTSRMPSGPLKTCWRPS